MAFSVKVMCWIFVKMITLARAINKINEYTFEVPKRQSIFTKVKWFQVARFR